MLPLFSLSSDQIQRQGDHPRRLQRLPGQAEEVSQLGGESHGRAGGEGRNQRVTGTNIAMFKRELGTDPRILTPGQTRVLVRSAEKPVHLEEEWKLDLLRELL